MTPHFAYYEIDGIFQVCYYRHDSGMTFRHPIFRAKDHIEATELCSRLNDIIPVIERNYVQNDPVFMLPDH